MNSQLKAWALDRAIETLKISATGTPSSDLVKSLADEYTAYVTVPESTPVAVEPDKGFDDDAAALAVVPAEAA